MEILKLKGYVGRDEDGHLALHRDKPIIRVYKGLKMYSSNCNKIALRRTLWPNLKFDDGIKQVIITIKEE